MRKGQLAISDLTVFFAFCMVVILLFGIVAFEKEILDSATKDKYYGSSAGHFLTSYLRTEINTDIDGDGVVDAETLADLIAMGGKDREVRKILSEEMRTTLNRINNENQAHNIRVYYPWRIDVTAGSFSMTSRYDATKMSTGEVFIPTADGGNIKITIISTPEGTGSVVVPE